MVDHFCRGLCQEQFLYAVLTGNGGKSKPSKNVDLTGSKGLREPQFLFHKVFRKEKVVRREGGQ